MRALVLVALLAACGTHIGYVDTGKGTPPDATSSPSDAAISASDAAPSTSDAATSSASDLGAYDPNAAVAYANAHWDDGVGLCAQFTSACLQAGGLDVDTSWVPTLFLDLAGYPFVEYDAATPTAVGGVPGDVVFYSNASGADFCIQSDPNAYNCGHVGLVVGAGADGDTATADFHDHAHEGLPLTGILGGTTDDPNSNAYSTYRVYHLGG